MSSTRSPQKPGAGGSVPPSVPAPIAIPAGGGGLPSAPSSNHVSTPGTHENLIGQLQERQQVFAQLGNFVQAMQNETGSVDVWRSKLKELEDLRNERRELKGEVQTLQTQVQLTTGQLSKAQESTFGLQRDIERLNSVVVSEKSAHRRVLGELQQWDAKGASLEAEVKRLSSEAAAAKMLAETNHELNTELGRMRGELEKQGVSARRAVEQANANSDAAEKEKKEISRHFWNLTEDVKVLKNELLSAARGREELQVELNRYKEENSAVAKGASELEAHLQRQIAASKAEAEEAKQRSSELDEALNLLRQEGMERPEHVQQLRQRLEAAETNQLATADRLESVEERAAGFLAALEKAQAENADLTDRLGGVENHHEAAQEELSRRAEAAQAAREELSAALAETDALREQLESVSLAAAEEKRTASQLAADRDKANRQLATERQALRNSEKQATESEATLRKRVQDLTRTVDSLEAALNSAKKDTHDARGDAAAQETQLATLVNQLQTELEKRLTELSETRGALDGSKRDVEQLKGSMAQQKEALGLKEREFAQAYVTERERLQREHETQLRKMSQIEGDKRDALHEITTLTQELHAARNDLGEATDEKRRFEKQLASSQRALETVKGERVELLEELKGLTQKQSEKDQRAERELSELRQAMAAAEMELKQSKKSSVHQTATLQEQIEAAGHEIRKHRADLEHVKEAKKLVETQLDEREAQLGGLRAAMEEAQSAHSAELSRARQSVGQTETQVQRAEEQARKKGEELAVVATQLKQMNSQCRELREEKRIAENRAREFESRVASTEEDVERLENDLKRLKTVKVELEENLYKSKHHLSKEQERASVLEKEGFHELRAVRGTVDGLRKRAEDSEEIIEDLKEEKEQLELKLSQLTTTSTANINGLVAQLKAQEESMKQERERVKFDSETWRTQMTELEHELDGAGNKWRSQLAAARDETERQRRAAYEMQAEVNESRVKLEARKREYDSQSAELEAIKDINRDLEARITKSKEALKQATRDSEAARVERDAATDAARKSEEANRKLRIEADNKSAGFSASNPYRAPAPMANRDRRNKYGTQLNADGTLPAESAEAYDDVASALSMQQPGGINAAPARAKPSRHPGSGGEHSSPGSKHASPGGSNHGSPGAHAMPQPHRQRPPMRNGGGGSGASPEQQSNAVSPGQYTSSSATDPIAAEIEAHMRARAAAIGAGDLNSEDENEDDGRGDGRGDPARGGGGGGNGGNFRAPGELKVPSPVQHGDEAANASISSTADFLARRRQRNRGQAQTGSAAEYGDPLPSNQQQQFDYGDDDDDDDDDDYGGGAGGGLSGYRGMAGKEDMDPQSLQTKKAISKRRGSGSRKSGGGATGGGGGNPYGAGAVHQPTKFPNIGGNGGRR